LSISHVLQAVDFFRKDWKWRKIAHEGSGREKRQRGADCWLGEEEMKAGLKVIKVEVRGC